MGVTLTPVPLLPLARTVAASMTAPELIEVSGDDVTLTVDRTHVERILHNLLRNARKHASSTTRIRILVERHEQGAVLVVEDDGPGVPSAIRDSLFEPFVHGPDAAASPSPGAGIGLALVSKFAELHGGRAWVEEAASGGARFVVLLGADAAGPSAAPATPAGNGRVVHADETDGVDAPLPR